VIEEPEETGLKIEINNERYFEADDSYSNCSWIQEAINYLRGRIFARFKKKAS